MLADIVAIGGTTAIEVAPKPDEFAQWYLGDDLIACQVAVDEAGTVLEFHWLGRHDGLPDDYAYIATFARRNPVRPGVGADDFCRNETSRGGAGFLHINVTIREDNEPGLGYYSVRVDVPLSDGRHVDRISERIDLEEGETA